MSPSNDTQIQQPEPAYQAPLHDASTNVTTAQPSSMKTMSIATVKEENERDPLRLRGGCIPCPDHPYPLLLLERSHLYAGHPIPSLPI
ncbi:hypothetical protein DL93DRAFT_1974425 [Clavulina sp. PMI_390]|nr:hypothetical protein DL93DRAFT_1974425 [Clavulina sp. PMI_390]